MLRLRLIRLEQQHKGKGEEKQFGHKWEQRLLLLVAVVVVSEFWVTVFAVVVVGSLAVVVVDF